MNPVLQPSTDRAQWLRDYRLSMRMQEVGHVVSVGDGIAWIRGLPSAGLDDLLVGDDGSHAMVFALTEDLIGTILLHQTPALAAGSILCRAGRSLGVPAGDSVLGRVIDPLGVALDGGRPVDMEIIQPLESPSPPIVARKVVDQPLYTGSKIIDTLIPIGKGQRQLLIGDDGLGRSSLAVDAVINQRGRDVLCIYVMIGQRRSAEVAIIETLREQGALDYTTIVVAEASALPGLQHLAPLAGCALAEYWMQQGRDTLVVYDDLSTHARIYRELSLLLRRPPGREAYPGDIFSIHARLLERATCLNAHNGGGSITALPIIETRQGELTGYIPTNLISITDGQIYLERSLFTAGFRPAIDIARSVSRIGGKAQHRQIKQQAGRMKLDYLQFLELEVFTRFGARLEASMEAALGRGRLLRQILKQDRLQPVPETFELAWMLAFNDGLLSALPLDQVNGCLARLMQCVLASELTLDSPIEQWKLAITQWIANDNRGGADEKPA